MYFSWENLKVKRTLSFEICDGIFRCPNSKFNADDMEIIVEIGISINLNWRGSQFWGPGSTVKVILNAQ